MRGSMRERDLSRPASQPTRRYYFSSFARFKPGASTMAQALNNKKPSDRRRWVKKCTRMELVTSPYIAVVASFLLQLLEELDQAVD